MPERIINPAFHPNGERRTGGADRNEALYGYRNGGQKLQQSGLRGEVQRSAASDRLVPFERPAPPLAAPAYWKPWYDDILDWIIWHPGRPLSECAETLGHSHGWISMIVRTDAFQAKLQDRRRARSAELDEAILTKTQEVAEASLDGLLATLKSKGTTLPVAVQLEVSDRMLERLGYGVKPVGPAVEVNVNTDQRQQSFGHVTTADLEAARNAIRQREATQLATPLREASSPEGVEAQRREVGGEVEVAKGQRNVEPLPSRNDDGSLLIETKAVPAE